MDKKQQILKAENFLALHHDQRLLILPNIWDPLGARLLQHMGYPAAATASAAVAYSLGYDDGQKITLGAMLETIHRVAAAVDIPVTADIEAGFAESPADVAENIRQVLRAGAVGINFEDSDPTTGQLYPIDFQCDRLKAVRAMADQEGIPLVINARIDVFISGFGTSMAERMAEAVTRGKAYVEAGADCLYPIVLGDLDALSRIQSATASPLNVYGPSATASLRELEAAGISRVSLGPGIMKVVLKTMQQLFEQLQGYGSIDLSASKAMASEEILAFVSQDNMT
ncbi:MAG: isocitrate lyase/phosphoenolpyruvate mutase family protein [Anaerolineae bacterium]|nr:isocitrate lyase/phosphoenolpyruvate mutase family protein [Anaerolineae bacterium]